MLPDVAEFTADCEWLKGHTDVLALQNSQQTSAGSSDPEGGKLLALKDSATRTASDAAEEADYEKMVKLVEALT